MDQPLKLDFNERSDKVSPLAQDSKFDALWRYPVRQSLEQEIAALYDLEESQVLCTNGGDEAIMILMRIIKECRQLILPLPAFSQYTWGVKSWQLDARLIAPKSDLSIDLAMTLNAIGQTSQSVTIITRPNNPTGELIALEDLLSILETAQSNNGWVFLDEAYIEFSDSYFDQPAQLKSLLNQFENLVVLRTLSKAFGLAGIRLGYLLGSSRLVQEFELRCMPFNVPQPSLTIASQALAQSNRSEVKNYCQTIAENRHKLTQWLTKLGIEVLPSQANFILLRLANNQARAVQSFLAKNNILVRAFGESELGDCLRITIPYQLNDIYPCLKQALAPELICLDMDGVLIDTSASYEATILKTVETLSGSRVKQDDIERLKNSGGFNNDWLVSQQLLSDNGVKLPLDRVIEVFQSIYLGDNGDGLVSNETPMIADSLIARCKAIRSCQFAVVTGRPRQEAIAGTRLIGLEALEIISLDDVEQPKPSAEGIKKLQNKFSKFSWMCGDNPDDMLAANKSNSLAIGIGRQNAETLYQAGADIVLDNINELEAWLCPIQ